MYQKPTKEERAAERAERDEDVPVIHQKNMQWQPSDAKLAAHRQSLEEVRRKLADATTATLRNALRSEIRDIKRVLSVKTDPKRRWQMVMFPTKHSYVPTFISPKGHRYVLAGRDDDAQLIIVNRKDAPIPFTRLRRFEKSPLQRMHLAAERDAKAHAKRKKAKKEHRKRRKQLKTTLLQETIRAEKPRRARGRKARTHS